MVREKDDKTLADPAINEWLKADSLKIIYLVRIAQGKHPKDMTDWPPPHPWDARWEGLKNAIDTGKLKATFANQATKNTIVSLDDFWPFAEGQGEDWQWARDICQRWADVRGEVLPPKAEIPTEDRQDKRGRPSKNDYEAFAETLKSHAKRLGGDRWISPKTNAELAEQTRKWMAADPKISNDVIPGQRMAETRIATMRKEGRLPRKTKFFRNNAMQ